MLIKIVRKCIDQLFGPEGPYAWLSDLPVAKGLVRVAPPAKSSADCFHSYFFHDFLGSDNNNDEDEDFSIRKGRV